MKEFELYLSQMKNTEHRTQLNELLEWILKTYPELKPEYKWNQPMLTHHGTFIMGFSAAKDHLSIAPEYKTMRKFEETFKELGVDYSMMMIRMKWKGPFNLDLIKSLIEFNMEDKMGCQTFWRKKE